MNGSKFHVVLVCLLAVGSLQLAMAQERTVGSISIENTDVKMFDGSKVPAESITLVVPEKRANPASRKLTLAIIRFKSTSENPGPPIIYLAGGPGNSGTFMAGDTSMQRLRQVGDLIFLDQRGTGHSKPKPVYMYKNPGEAGFFLSADRAEEMTKKVYREAYDALTAQGVDLTGYNSEDSADDIEALRQALGYEKVSLLGFSYGTHLALATIKRHGVNIHRAVLVGTEGLSHTLKFPSTLDLQIEKISLLAERDPDLAGWPNFIELTKQALAKLEREPVTVTVHDRRRDKDVDVKIGSFGLQFFLRIDVGDGNDIPVLPALMKSILNGDYDLLRWFAAKRYNQIYNIGINLMSEMTDASSSVNPGRLMTIRIEMGHTLLGEAVNMMEPDVWTALDNPDLGPDYRAPFASSVETLFVSGTLDSNAPPVNAEDVRRGFPFSRHIIVEYAGHEDMLPMPEVQDEIVRFFSNGTIKGDPIMHAVPDFLDVEAAKKNRGIGSN